MKLGFEEFPIVLHQRLAKRAGVERSLGEDVGVLPALRQCEDFLLPQQQSTG